MAKVSSISHIPYRAWDRDKSFDFFVDVLGFRPHIRGSITYVGMGDTLVELMTADPGADAEAADARYVLGVEVDDLDAMLETVLQKGATVVRPIFNPVSFWGRQAVISVPGGPSIALREYRAPDGPHFEGWHPE